MSRIGGVLFIGLALAIGCGERSAPSNPTAQPSAGGACGITLFDARYDPRCQQNLDATCCAAERACAADQGCAHIISCMNACPKSESCMAACGNGLSQASAKALDDVGRCSKYEDKNLPPAAKCQWPGGGGPPFSTSDLRQPSFGIRWNPSPGCSETVAVDSDGTVWRARSCPPEPAQPLRPVRPMGRGFHQAVAADFAPLHDAFNRRNPNEQCAGGAQFEEAYNHGGGGTGACLDRSGRPTDPAFQRAWDRLQSAAQ